MKDNYNKTKDFICQYIINYITMIIKKAITIQ